MIAFRGQALGRIAPALVALLLGVLFVAAFDAALAPTRYPYSADSASYIEMADSLRAEGRPRVTPWDLERGGPDAIPQLLFPPGFAVVVAAVAPLAGDTRTAAVMVPRVAAALLPLLIVVLFRGVARPWALVAAGMWILVSPGVRGWQFIAYSDVPALLLACAAIGILLQCLTDGARGAPVAVRRWLLAGLLAGLGYTVRNSGIAVLGVAVAVLTYARLRGWLGTRPLVLWAAGAAAPLALLAAYNLTTFGVLQPYTMPHSERAWTLNVGDYARAQLWDAGLAGASRLPPGIAIALIVGLFAVLLAVWWRCRADPVRHLQLSLLGAYALGGGVLLVVSRSRYEWGNLIDDRNVLQYSFAVVLAVVAAAVVVLPPRARRIGAMVAVLGLLGGGIGVARDAAHLYRSPAEIWLGLSRNPAVIAAARDLPADTLISSNYSVLFRIGARRAVRQLDVSGSDADLAGSLRAFADLALERPAVFLLVCDSEWTPGFSACQPGAPPAGPLCRRITADPVIVARCDARAAAGEGPP